MEILALIPARSGSKSIQHKNIQSVHGTPLMAYSIQFGCESKLVTRTILSTDSEDYAAIGRSHGAQTPFLRPKELAQDLSTDWEVFHHALT
jgi:N-acylneuraminate cytidylyltransferase